MGYENYEETKRGIRRGTAIVVDVVFILFHKILTIMDAKNFNVDFEIPQNMQEELLGGKGMGLASFLYVVFRDAVQRGQR